MHRLAFEATILIEVHMTERVRMNNTTAQTSSNNYYRHGRPEMLRRVPSTAERVLELGCAEGAFAATVKERTGAEVWGI